MMTSHTPPFARQATQLASDRRAVTALEYGMIAAAVVAIGLAGFSVVGSRVATKFTAVKGAFVTAPATPPID